ncbi:glycoside hydrolase family 43 protein [Herbiconiux sp. CPCC 205716]|uniref:Glycoside hydrolase family 43 protein n=1 Tax=Herbiconiux gentiana TaxID=2970912 RepID=A0ABT2GAE8_9MICO|nr:glycoside hydrolase family 43 protein [Herbiconiux gentiana]MCS5713163.1 glycoside hydrolase family 43 protein [Herbiconiux gentiana]
MLVRDAMGGFHILATDLNVESGEGDWGTWVRSGSRSLVLWDSADLVTWSGPRLVEIAPPEAGMAWAPESILDPETGEHLVFWSSKLYSSQDPSHQGEAYSRILSARTRDFVTFSPAEIFIDSGRDVIDTTILIEGGRVHRFGKAEEIGSSSPGVYHEVGSTLFSNDFRTLASRIAAETYDRVEAPIIVRDHRVARWYLYLDQYAESPQGYFALETDDLLTGDWRSVDPARVVIRPGTKHGGILHLARAEWEHVANSLVMWTQATPVKTPAIGCDGGARA